MASSKTILWLLLCFDETVQSTGRVETSPQTPKFRPLLPRHFTWKNENLAFSNNKKVPLHHVEFAIIWHLASNVIMSQVQRSLEARDMANESRQHELWGWLVCFLVISNLSIVGRLWGTWKSVSTRSKVVAEDVFIGLSGVSAALCHARDQFET